MYKPVRGVSWVLAASVGASAMAGCTDGAIGGTGKVRQDIHNGTMVSDINTRNGPWVTINVDLPGGFVRVGSGILLDDRTVLTAAHVPYELPTKAMTVYLGNSPGEHRSKVEKVVSHRSYHRFLELFTYRNDGKRVTTLTWDNWNEMTWEEKEVKAKDPFQTPWMMGFDVALLRLKGPLPVVNLPAGKQCGTEFLPDSYDVVSGALARLTKKNSGNFLAHSPNKTDEIDLSPFPGKVVRLLLDPVDITPMGQRKKVLRHFEGGDSGSAVMAPESDRDKPSGRAIHGVFSTSGEKSKIGKGIALTDDLCDWIDTVVAGLHAGADFTERDDILIDDEGNIDINGIYRHYIASFTVDGAEVELAAGSGVEKYRIKLPEPPPSEMRAAEIGTFSDSGAALAFLNDGEFIGRNLFDDTPLTINATGKYTDLMVVKTKSPDQPYNDLIAIHAGDTGADLFEGEADGLSRADVDGIAITRVDDDAWADVIVADGASIRVATPVSVATTTLPFVPVGSTSGRFTSNEPNTGFDLAFMGQAGSTNQVAWCPIEHPTGLFRDGGCTTLAMPDALEPIAIRATFYDDDEYEDLEVAFRNGQVGIFGGSATDLTFRTFLQGLPSARSDDGKALLLSGTESDTLGVPTAEFYVSEPVDASNTPTSEPLLIQVYDFDITGSYDNLPEDSGLSTCLNLYASPTPGATGDVLLKEIGETEIGGDLHWQTVFDSQVDGHSPDAQSASGVHWYRIEMKLVHVEDECDAAPVVNHAGFNGFKLRTSGQLRSPNAVALYAVDSFGDFASFEAAPNTDYDGIFDIPFQVGGNIEERPEVPDATPLNITLQQADADDPDVDADADGQRDDVFFQLFEGTPQDGTALEVQRTAGQQEDDFNIPTDKVDDPSGNASGDKATAVFERHTTEGISGQTVQPGLHTWHWENIGAENAIQLQPITGSPINHEYIATGGRWVSSSSSTTPSRLLELADVELESLLPIEVGDAGFGNLRSFSSVDAVRQGLTLDSKDLKSLLWRELLALKLNQKRSARRAEPLGSAFVLSTRTSVADLIEEVDAMLGGTEGDLDPGDALRLMATANAGQVTYLSPRELVLSSADRDADGIMDAQDNCVMRANADQLDSNGDGIGDRCEPTPTVWCVESRESGGAVAVFGYDSPLRDFRIPAGASNEISGEGVDATPPVLFRRDGLRQAVSVPFDGDSVMWQVLDKSATATFDAPTCSDIGPGSAVCEASASEFHCCTSIADCQVAGQFALYATESIHLGERVSVLDSDWRPGALLSLGSIVMDTEADAGDVMGGGELVVGDRVGLFGDIALAGNLTEIGQPTSFRTRYVPLDAPDLSAFARPFEGEATTPLSMQDAGELDPGHYGPTELVGGATTLVAGEYHFTSLAVAEEALLIIDGSTGPVTLHVAGSLRLLGEVDARAGELLLELHGPGEALVSTDLAATIIAPEGRIVVDQPGSVQTGAYYARSIEIASDVTVVQHEPLAPRL